MTGVAHHVVSVVSCRSEVIEAHLFQLFVTMSRTDTNASYYDHVKDRISSIYGIISEVKELDTKNVKNLGNKIEILESRFKTEIDFFQLQPHLLDRDIGIWIKSLLDIVRDSHGRGSSTAEHGESEGRDKIKTDLAFTCCYLTTKVRGFKNVLRHFPHEVSDVESVMDMISAEDATDKTNWETKYVLLLWLSVLVLIPFDLKRFDVTQTSSDHEVTSSTQTTSDHEVTSPTQTTSSDGPTRRPLMERIFTIIKTYLGVSLSVSKYAASFLGAKFLTRPEVESTYLNEFIEWCVRNIIPVSDRCAESESMSLQLMTLTYFFKIGKREVSQPHSVRVLRGIQEANLLSCKDDNLLKCIMKCVQRIGLVFLRNKVAPWRYQRGKRFISDTNTPDVGGDVRPGETVVSTGSGVLESGVLESGDEEEDDSNFDHVEEVIDILLTGLRSPSTIIRWSAAKGIGRICHRLPRSMAVSVLECILSLFSGREKSAAWHAACLTLAELGRRGLILPADLPRVFSVVKKALVYDEVKGSTSVGSDVRDAACYVFWSFGRAYDKETMAPFVDEMASSLIITALFDREVNCRRAGAAAFQENVGRQSSFPDGIQILTTIDYTSVGQKKNCYTSLVTFIGRFESYHEPLVRHLIQRKVNHWDSEIRELTAEALHRLMLVLSPSIIHDVIIPSLESHSTSHDINARHGSLLATAQALAAFRSIHPVPDSSMYPVPDSVPDSFIHHISGLVDTYNRMNFFTTTGSELMKQAFCTLILQASNSAIPLKLVVVKSWIDVIKATIFYVNPTVRTSGVKCLPFFCCQYLSGSNDSNRDQSVTMDTDQSVAMDTEQSVTMDTEQSVTILRESLFESILERIRDMEEGIRCGSFEAMAVFPISLISDQNRKLFIDIVINYILSEKTVDKSMTEARASAITCLTSFLVKLTAEKSVDELENSLMSREPEKITKLEEKPEKITKLEHFEINHSYLRKIIVQVYQGCLVNGTNDYTIGSRGDIGFIVRKSSLLAIHVSLLFDLSFSLFSLSFFSSLFFSFFFLSLLFLSSSSFFS